MKMQENLLILAAAIVLALAGCSADEGINDKAGFVDQVVDSVTSTVVASLAETARPDSGVYADMSQPAPAGDVVFHVTDMVIVEPKLYATFDGGVAVYDFIDKKQSFVRDTDKLTAVAVHEGTVYVGGSTLYQLMDDSLEPVDIELRDTVTSLYSHGHRLMIGTTDGLYSRSVFGDELLLEDVAVSAMVADEGGLWVGTAGQGLYRWDGEEFHKRFLVRDTALFDTVNAIDFRYYHVYVGTTNGLHIFNGGRWDNLSTEDGLPSNNVTAIDASQWVVYVGTDQGVVSYFNGEITPVTKLDDRAVTALRLRGRKIVAGTAFEGILLKSRSRLKTIIQPVVDSNLNVLSLVY